jgi:hypothetical protein
MGEISSFDRTDVIAYRTLRREDFKGRVAPPAFAAVADRVGAATCGEILTHDSTHIKVETVVGLGAPLFEASIHGLEFLAQMDRRCSWWNRAADHSETQAAYVLEHEQIHFALFELGARRMNAEREAMALRMRSRGATQEEAIAKGQQRLQQEVSAAVQSTLDRNRDFDEDTSLGYALEDQQRWWETVQRELGASAP